MRSPEWLSDPTLPCRGLTDLFYADAYKQGPGRSSGPRLSDEAVAAKRICDGCRRRRVCAEHALATGERDGIWGGLTARERWERRKAADRKVDGS